MSSKTLRFANNATSENMKILIVSQYYYPEQFQINEIAPELVKRGHDVTVICGIPNYPKGKVFPGYEDKF